MNFHRTRLDVKAFGLAGIAVTLIPHFGCNSVLNGWLDPTVVGSFSRSTTLEIRTSLSLEDSPTGIPGASGPIREDQRILELEYPITPGDVLLVEIHELRQRGAPFQAQVQVTETGQVNLPVVGRVEAGNRTVSEFEQSIIDALIDRQVLLTPEVTVNPIQLQKATYSIFGIGVSAADNSPLRAGNFPIRRPDLRILEAINQVGGLNEFVSDVYIFRRDSEAGTVPPSSGNGNGSGSGKDSFRPLNGNGARLPENGVKPNGASHAPAPAFPAEDLMEAARPGRKPEETPPEREQAPVLEPERPTPYIYVNNEFVPNPEYRKDTESGDDEPIEPTSVDSATPAMNWARLAGETAHRIIRIPAESLRLGDPDMNIFVRAGDIIRIVSGEIGQYYVMGQVNRVGPFSFNAEHITLKAAIAAAGGLAPLAWPDRCTIYRRLGQREQMIQVNLDRIFAGLDPDFTVKRGDIINVGTHPFAPFLQRIRSWTLPTPVNNVGYSYTYSRNFADVDSFAVRQNPHNEPERFPNLFP